MSDSKKILMVSDACYPELSPRAFRTTELARELAREGHRVTLLIPNRQVFRDDPLQADGLRVIFADGTVEGRGGSAVARRNKSIRRFIPKFAQRWILYFYCHEFFAKYNPGIFRQLVALDEPPFRGDVAPNVFPAYYLILKCWGRRFDYFTIPVEKALDCYTPYKSRERIKIIPQGFDLTAVKRRPYEPNPQPTFAYAGRFYEWIRDPEFFFDFLETLDADFRFDLYINYLDPCFAEMIRQAQQRVRGRIVLREALPRERLIERLGAADFLINFDNTTSNATPSKLIDYAMTGRPILSFNDRTFDPDGFRAALRGDYRAQVRGIDLSQYDIRNVAAQFIDLIDAGKQKE